MCLVLYVFMYWDILTYWFTLPSFGHKEGFHLVSKAVTVIMLYTNKSTGFLERLIIQVYWASRSWTLKDSQSVLIKGNDMSTTLPVRFLIEFLCWRQGKSMPYHSITDCFIKTQVYKWQKEMQIDKTQSQLWRHFNYPGCNVFDVFWMWWNAAHGLTDTSYY